MSSRTEQLAEAMLLVVKVRALASNYDAAFNRQDAVTIAGLYAQNAVFYTPEGTETGCCGVFYDEYADRKPRKRFPPFR